MAKSKKTKKKGLDFEPSGFFAWRTPLLPFEELIAFGADLEACAARAGSPEKLDEALGRDRALLRGRLGAILERPEVREAIFVASPDLAGSLEVWRREPESERGQKVERSLMRYFVRMGGRSTPFGLFSGCSVGTLDRETDLRLEPRERYGRHTRLDMDYLNALTDALAADPETRRSLRLRPNTSLYRSSRYYRYVEGTLDPASRSRDYNLSSVEVTDYLEATLERALAGALPADLAQALVDDDPEVTVEEANEYIEELVDNQILVPELQPVVTGTEAIDDLLESLGRHPHLAHIQRKLDETRGVLAELDRGGVGSDPQTYHEVAGMLEDLPAKVRLPRLFQVDMVKPSPSATLGRAVVRDLEDGIALLHRLTPPPGEGGLARFRGELNARYEGQEVPLVEALDEELGIGFESSNDPSAEASPLLEGIAFPPPPGGPQVRLGAWEGMLFQLLCRALRDGARELVLDDRDIDGLAAGGDAPPLPDAFAAMATLVAASTEAVRGGDYRLIFTGASGPSGGRLLGRFCHADPVLEKHVVEHLRAEEALQPDAIFAEIVHLPQGRIGNILFRPVLRGHEIPFLGRSGADPERLIPITDLLVSVAGERVVLRSKRLGCEVIPRLTSAHNFSARSLGIYRFLCSLQSQGTSGGVGFSWFPFDSAPCLPRVRHGRLVLARATWNLTGRDLEPLRDKKKKKKGGAKPFEVMQELRDRLGWPRWVVVSDGDNTLPVDLDNVLGVETAAHLLKGRPAAKIAELYPGPDDLCAHGPEGRFMHELVVPFVRRGEPRPVPEIHAEPSVEHRSYPPGSEWIYVKLYTGTSTADQVLREVVRPVVDEVMPAKHAEQWFFIRYSDPEWHLRLRFFGDPRALNAEVLPRIERAVAPLLSTRQIWRLQLDTYEPEVSRYGGSHEALRVSERLFCIDSDCVLSLVEALDDEESPDARWQLALYGVHRLLLDLGLDLLGQLEVMRRMRASYGQEFRENVLLKRQLGGKYRSQREGLMALIRGEQDEEASLAVGVQALSRRSTRLSPEVGKLHEVLGADGIQAIAPSFVHMFTNRLLRSAARAQELVLYDLLLRLYQSQKARG